MYMLVIGDMIMLCFLSVVFRFFLVLCYDIIVVFGGRLFLRILF